MVYAHLSRSDWLYGRETCERREKPGIQFHIRQAKPRWLDELQWITIRWSGHAPRRKQAITPCQCNSLEIGPEPRNKPVDSLVELRWSSCACWLHRPISSCRNNDEKGLTFVDSMNKETDIRHRWEGIPYWMTWDTNQWTRNVRIACKPKLVRKGHAEDERRTVVAIVS